MIKERKNFMEDENIQRLFTYCKNWNEVAKLEIEFLNTLDLASFIEDRKNDEVYQIRNAIEDEYGEDYKEFLKAKGLDPEEYGEIFNVLDDDDFITYMKARYEGLAVYIVQQEPEYYFYEKMKIWEKSQ